ncbi:MAG: phosphoenolpyruvate carboxykinase, partial [Clostridia bacterium]|nr:phosphoenolpyruvate carboxykinase [Clostridia bacterium]
MTNNKKVLQFVADCKAFANPDEVVWFDGSDKQRDALRAEACATGEMIKLNQELLPDCYYHRTAENDVARVEDRTFICCENEEDALPHSIVKWKSPKEAYAMVNEIARNAYAGRKMYVIPYSMGVVGSPFSKIGIEITDSIYVVLNMMIMTRVGKMCLDQLG